MSCLFEIEKLNVCFYTTEGIGYALTDVTANIQEGRVTVILGESGSGKSVLAAAMVGLLPTNSTLEGSIRFKGRELLDMRAKEWDQIRGLQIAWIAQNPLSSLNPIYSTAELISESAIYHKRIPRREKWRLAQKHLENVLLDPSINKRYSFELSGGMAQRVLMATGLALQAPFVILDEPTKGLDVQNVARIEEIVRKLAAEGRTLLIITHDVDFAEAIADEIWIFYGSQLIEQASCAAFFEEPLHPYAKALLASTAKRGLHPIPGESPSFYQKVQGCSFYGRCERARADCRSLGQMLSIGEDRRVKCLLH